MPQYSIQFDLSAASLRHRTRFSRLEWNMSEVLPRRDPRPACLIRSWRMLATGKRARREVHLTDQNGFAAHTATLQLSKCVVRVLEPELAGDDGPHHARLP